MINKSPHPSKPSTHRACPICKTPVTADSRWLPFCSDRCKTIDLGKWASGQYLISRPIEQADLDEV